MMSVTHLRKEEQIGLGLAVAAHAALAVALMLQPSTRDKVPVPERMTVSLSTDVGLTSTAPNPVKEAQASVAPTISEMPAPPVVEEAPPKPVERVTPPAPEPRPVAKPVEKPKPAPKPVAKPAPKPEPKKPEPKQEAPSKTAPKETAAPKPKTETKSGGSRIGSDFLEGTSSSSKSTTAGVVGEKAGPAELASLVQAINRQLKPKWTAPQGPDAELLVTVLAWDLNEDGSLAGRPRVVSQSGVNDTNRNQAARHAEQAIKAVQLAAPFDLPVKYYSSWKRISSFRFDRKLDQ